MKYKKQIITKRCLCDILRDHYILQKEGVNDDYNKYNPDHRQIYKFIRTLFNAATLTAECAIITLVYLER